MQILCNCRQCAGLRQTGLIPGMIREFLAQMIVQSDDKMLRHHFTLDLRIGFSIRGSQY
jgi:hypothetical protein